MADFPGEIHPASGGDVFPDECIRLGCDHPDLRGTRSCGADSHLRCGVFAALWTQCQSRRVLLPHDDARFPFRAVPGDLLVGENELGMRNGGAAHKKQKRRGSLKLATFSYRKPNP